ncbi:MAG: CoA-disulfide reductase [Candidatus Izemoplasmataceae bacterium]
MNVLIIGAVAAGMSTASKLRRLDESIKITVLEKGKDVSYGACGLPYFLSDMISDEQKLIARTPEKFIEQGINLLLNHEAIEVNHEEKTVKAFNHETKEERIFSYDKLVIATGTSPIRLPVEGKNLKGIHTLNSLEDGRRLKAALNKPDVKKVAVVGAGYIGLEVAENLIEMGKEVIIIEKENRVLTKFSELVSKITLETLLSHDISVNLNETVMAYHGKDHVTHVITDDATYQVDLVIEAIGVIPNTKFLENIPFERLSNGAIITNKRMETSVKDIYAAGDCVAYYHRILKTTHSFLPLGTHANKAGRVIAENIAGENSFFEGVIGSSVIKVFDLEIARTGLDLKEAKAHHINAKSVHITAKDRSSYYPNAKNIDIEIIYNDDTCQLLGAYMIGKSGVAHRINTIATAVSLGMTAEEYAALDYAYAPPFSPVYDPVQIATNQIKCKK